MFSRLGRRVSVLVRRSALALAGAALVCVALAFFTTAAWLGLRSELGAVWAAAIIGGAYLIAGLACLLLARDPQAGQPIPPDPLADAPMERVIRAFVEGIAAGRTSRRR